MDRRNPTERWLLAALAVFGFFNALAWIRAIPPGSAPDEPGHFEVVAFEAVFHRIPVLGVDDYGALAKTAADGRRSPVYPYSAQPGLSYIVSAAAIELSGSRDPGAAVLAARFPGALWSAAMPLVVFAGVSRMFPRRRDTAVLAATLSVCWPQLTFVFSYVNNDGLAALVCAAFVASWYAGARNGWRLRDAILSGTIAGLVLLGKPNGFPLIAAGAVALGLTLRGPARDAVRKASAAVSAALVISGWWYAIALGRYGLDLFGEHRAGRLAAAQSLVWPSGRLYGLTMWQTAFERFPRYGDTWLRGTMRSFLGMFGEMTIGLQPWVYRIAFVLVVASIPGVVKTFRAAGAEEERRIYGLHYATAALIPLSVVLAFYRSWAFDYQAQGRHLFPAMLPFLALLSSGLLGLFVKRPFRVLSGIVISAAALEMSMSASLVTLFGAYDRTLPDAFAESPASTALWLMSAAWVCAVAALYWARSEATLAPNPVSSFD